MEYSWNTLLHLFLTIRFKYQKRQKTNKLVILAIIWRLNVYKNKIRLNMYSQFKMKLGLNNVCAHRFKETLHFQHFKNLLVSTIFYNFKNV